MFFRVLLVAFLASHLSFADDALEREWRWKASRSIRFAPRERAEIYVREALEATEAYLRSRTVAFRRIEMVNSAFPALELTPDPSLSASPLNQVAERVRLGFSGARMIYSPGDLMAGAEGFFSPRDLALGISNEMLELQAPDSIFCHESIHASHFVSRLEGVLDPLSAVARVVSNESGLAVSGYAGGYRRLQTFEEVEAHVETIVRQAKLLEQAPREKTLTAIYRNAEESGSLVRATADIALRAAVVLRGGQVGSWIPGDDVLWSWTVRLPAIRRGFASSVEEIPDGMQVRWEVAGQAAGQGPRYTADDLASMLDAAAELSRQLEAPLRQVQESMYWMIERADLPRTDVPRVLVAVERVRGVLAEWKARHSRTTIRRHVGAPLCE